MKKVPGPAASMVLALTIGAAACRGILGLADDPYLDVDAAAPFSDTGADDAGDARSAAPDAPTGDARVDADATSEASVDAADAGEEGGPKGNDAATDGGKCPTSDMIVLVTGSGSFCIDPHEVTNAQFNIFLSANPFPFDVPLPACSGDIGDDGGDPNRPSQASPPEDVPPVLDYCYAWAYCRFAGKRLCGQVAPSHDDAGAPHSDGTGSASTEWGYACSNGGKDTYPYGNAYDASVCNTNADAAVAPGAMADCHGLDAGFDQLFDMSGNVAEYDDFWSESNGISDHGGYWGLTGAATACNAVANFGATTNIYHNEVGIRCCSDVR